MNEQSSRELDMIRDLIRERSGIWLNSRKRKFLGNRLAIRMKATNMESVKEYYFYLKYDPNGDKEIEALIDEVTVNETYFFREKEILAAFTEKLLPSIADRKKFNCPINIWSAGCSRGEEPYTLAMMLEENPLINLSCPIDILGSDISPTALGAAREGIYDSYSLRHTPEEYKRKYFENGKNETYHLKERVKKKVRFAHANLMDPRSTRRVGNMDCILCRNVIIYFSDPDKYRCIENLYESLNKGGYLILGHAESLGRIVTPLEAVRVENSVVYHKPK